MQQVHLSPATHTVGRFHQPPPVDTESKRGNALTLHWTGSSASVGWALFDGSDADLEAVLHQADQAMYQLKRAGRGDSAA